MIPRVLHRTVPTVVSEEARAFWQRAKELHPTWLLLSHQDPLEPSEWPLTARYWDDCSSGAQMAGLIRLEALWTTGGFYVDSDWEPYRPLDPLLGADLVAGWEDSGTIPDAVLGASPSHPLIRKCLAGAIENLSEGAWTSGPGVTTSVLGSSPGVLLLPPGSLYPYHYTEPHRRHEDHRAAQPWAFGAHHWAGSWLS